MVLNDFMSALCELAEDATSNMLLPIPIQNADDTGGEREANVYKWRVPGSGTSWQKKAPYVIVQSVSIEDKQYSGNNPKSKVAARFIVCVWNKDEQEGMTECANVMERLRAKIEQTRILADRYELDMDEGVDYLMYTDDTYPYYGCEIDMVWKIPSYHRNVNDYIR